MVTMISGVYICSVCLRQFGGLSAAGRLSEVQMIDRPCETVDVEPLEKPYLHFPKPKSFSR